MNRTIRTAYSIAFVVALTALVAACAAVPGAQQQQPPSAPPAPPSASRPSTPKPAAPAPTSFAAASTTANIGGCEVYPRDHFLNAVGIDRLPVHPRSDDWIRFLGRDDATLKPPSSSVWENARGGMPVNVVDSRERSMSSVVVNPWWSSRSYTGKYPIPRSPRVEGHPSAQWDRHLIMVDVADCTAYELLQYERWGSTHAALSGTRYPLDSTDIPIMTTNAADTPMVGQYAMADEVIAGALRHAIGFCTTELSSDHIWPAQHSDGVSDHPDAPPMGAWLRLRADVDLSGFTGQARVIAEGLRDHGMFLTDTCGHQIRPMFENSDHWNDEPKQLRVLTADDFEAVDTSSLMKSEDSFAVR